MADWQEDKRWSDRFLPEIKQILGLYLIGEPPIEEDAEHNTDLIVLKMEAVRIACRVRRHEYYLNYPDDITIRAGRPGKNKTELAKIIEGWGDFFFYGFSNQDETRLCAWKLCDLKPLRLWLAREAYKSTKIQSKENHDGSSSFIPIDTRRCPQIVYRKLDYGG